MSQLCLQDMSKTNTQSAICNISSSAAIDKLLAVCGDSGSSSSSSRKKKCEFPEAPSGINRL